MYFAAAAFVITVAPPFVIALMITGSVSGATLSRFGPTLPTVPAALSVWQTPQVETKSGLPAFGLPTILAEPCARANAGIATASISAATTPSSLPPPDPLGDASFIASVSLPDLRSLVTTV